MKIGDVVWIKEEYSYTYNKKEVVGETSRSWIVLPPDALDWQRSELARYGKKLPKSGNGWTPGTEEDAKLHLWAQSNRWKIGSAVDGERDAKILLQIAVLIGYKDLPENNA